MSAPKVSVIIPAYNQADYLGQAIESVVDQSYPDWELIVVDDGSTDGTAAVVAQFDDPRLHYTFQANKGLPAARNSGIVRTSGEYLAFLDADDWYHPDKVALQAAHLDRCPEVGLSYGSRIETDSIGNPLWLIRAPVQVNFTSLALGFPFTINDLLVRRSWLEKVGGFDESLVIHGEDRELYLRLMLEGCQFAEVDRLLSYRRFYAGRIFHKIPERLAMMLRVLESAFADPRCPGEALAVAQQAYANIYLTWARQEWLQSGSVQAHEYWREAMRLDSSLLKDGGQSFLRSLLWVSVKDGGDHEAPLRKIMAQLPPELAALSERTTWAVTQGYLLRGARDLIWGRLEEGRAHFASAREQRWPQGQTRGSIPTALDDYFLRSLNDQLLNYAAAFGAAATEAVFRKMMPELEKVGPSSAVRRLRGYFTINQAFDGFQQKAYASTLLRVLQSIIHDPGYLVNRGVLSIFARSLLHTIAGVKPGHGKNPA